MWTVILSVCVTIISIMSLMLCMCWRKKTPKNDLLGLHGMVTQKNPDENVNHLPSAAPYVVNGVNVNANATSSSNDANKKRNTLATNTRRSLPDIPSEQGTAIHWDPTADSSSEHYATLGQYQHSKRHTLPNGIEARPSISQHSSISQADDAFSPYEKVKYSKVKSKEHPYDQLHPTTSRQPVVEDIQGSSDERTTLLRNAEAGPSGEPLAPPRSRRSSVHSDRLDIPAASAVAGGIAANPELPYMTPPITQPNFSGDSQDSSKGYTSITVREPLANIKAQTKEYQNRDAESHYSSDSDDVYTTIPDPNNQIYTSESETYARIPALPMTVEAEVNPIPSRCVDSNDSHPDDDDDDDELYEPAPQPPPPSVDSLKQATGHSHSRQASSSSSIGIVGSPKPEKRQANSPLPPPPSLNQSLDQSAITSEVNKVQTPRNLDDLYAKVYKNKKKDDELPVKVVDDRKSGSTSSSNEEKIDLSKRREHNYETLKKKDAHIARDYEEPGYASINNGPDSITSSDPGYEVLKQKTPSEIDPNYEQLRHRVSNASECSGYSNIKDVLDGYSVVNKIKTSDNDSRISNSSPNRSSNDDIDNDNEPNYESMPNSESYSDNNYQILKTDSDCDPNYEILRNSNERSFGKVRGHGYEDIDTSESSNGDGIHKTLKVEPPYEQLLSDNEGDVPGYEIIGKRLETNNNAVLEENDAGDDSVFQV